MPIKSQVYQFKTILIFFFSVVILTQQLVLLIFCVYFILNNNSMSTIFDNNIDAPTFFVCNRTNKSFFIIQRHVVNIKIIFG